MALRELNVTSGLRSVIRFHELSQSNMKPAVVLVCGPQHAVSLPDGRLSKQATAEPPQDGQRLEKNRLCFERSTRLRPDAGDDSHAVSFGSQLWNGGRQQRRRQASVQHSASKTSVELPRQETPAKGAGIVRPLIMSRASERS